MNLCSRNKVSSIVALLVLITLSLANGTTAVRIKCDNFSEFDLGYSDGILKSCNMETSTSISSTGITINSARDETITRMSFSNNKNIFYLPDDVNENFPNLLRYNAKRCSITLITKTNFKGLNKLVKLNLWGNQLEKITSDTFKDLVDLQVLKLGEMIMTNVRMKNRWSFFSGENKIKFMNGEVFQGLNELSEVYLQMNVCIDNFFTTHSSIESMPEVVNENCRFHESRLRRNVLWFCCIKLSINVETVNKSCQKTKQIKS